MFQCPFFIPVGRKDDGYDMGKMVSENGERKDGKGKRTDRDGAGRVEWKGYVSPTLSTAEKKAYRTWAADTVEVNRAVSTTIDSRYTLKIDYMENDGAYRAGLYCQKQGHPDAGYCLTVFAGDWWEATMRVVYCHIVLLNSSWASLTGKGKWKDDWVD